MAGERIFDRIERLANTLERMQLDKYLAFVSDKKRMLWMAFLGGAARGVGFMFGVSTLGALAVAVLKSVVIDNIPGIGEFLREVLNEIDSHTR